MSLVIVGGGNMGQALLSGLTEVGFPDLTVVEHDEEHRRDLAERFPDVAVRDTLEPGDDALIAVKPHDVEAVCRSLGSLGYQRILSIAAGVRLRSLTEWAGRPVALVRAMPNTPALIGRGVTAIASESGREAIEWAESLMVSVGTVVQVEEPQLDAVTAVSGSGPAYVFLLAEAMMQAAKDEGLPSDVAELLVRETVAGAGLLLARSEEPVKVLRQRVTSPGGTTEAAITSMTDGDFTGLVERAVNAARRRGEELGRAPQ